MLSLLKKKYSQGTDILSVCENILMRKVEIQMCTAIIDRTEK